ncbi:MAG: type II toxin-antitoxin system RelE/ParE family toxin [Devosia sp.]
MSREVIWSPEARADIQQVLEYLSQEAPAYADKVVERLIDAGNGLGAAQTGRPGRMRGTYERSLPDVSYIIAYYVSPIDPDGPVLILHAIHMSRNWPSGTWPSN